MSFSFLGRLGLSTFASTSRRLSSFTSRPLCKMERYVSNTPVSLLARTSMRAWSFVLSSRYRYKCFEKSSKLFSMYTSGS